MNNEEWTIVQEGSVETSTTPSFLQYVWEPFASYLYHSSDSGVHPGGRNHREVAREERVNILDLEKRIKLIMYKTIPCTVAAHGIVFTTELEWRTGRDLFHHHHFLYRKKIAGGDVVELHPRCNPGARFIPLFGEAKGTH